MPTRSRFSLGRDAILHCCRRLLPCLTVFVLQANSVAAADDEWIDPLSGLTFVRIAPGCFDQGEDQVGPTHLGILVQWPRDNELPRRRVCVDGFWLGKTEVTNAQWARVMTPSNALADGNANRPKTDVSWEHAQDFLAVLNQRAAAGGVSYRLPGETEWEYACQAGTRPPAPKYHGEERAQLAAAIERQACFSLTMTTDPQSCQVASRAPNAWGLYDMLGNVWEWVGDRYAADAYRRPPQGDSRVSGGDVPRVIRGGSYKSDLAQVRCGVRNFAPAADRSMVIGLRVLMQRGTR